MKLLLMIPIIAMITYLTYVYKKYGMTFSISATYKQIKGMEKMWFTVTLWLIALPIMCVAINSVTNKLPQVLFFTAGALICVIAVSPEYWINKMELTVHLVGSYGGIILGMVACLIGFKSTVTITLIITYIMFVILSQTLKMRNNVYWIEVGAILTVIMILILNI